MLCCLVERSLCNWENFSQNSLTRCVEFCSGCGNLTKALGKWRACCFDLIYDDAHDMLTKPGCRLYLDAVSSLGKMALIWLGVPCSSWVPLCSSVSKRKPENGFFGDTDRAFVKTGNAQMVITSIIMFIRALLGHGHCIILEQPLGSSLPKVKPLSTVLTFFKMHKFVTYGGAFGGPSVKPLQLWGTHLVFKNLKERGLIPIYLKIPWQHGQVVVDLPVILGCWQSQLNTHPCLVRKWLSVMPVFCQQLAFSPLTLTRLWLVTIILIHWRWRNVAVCAGLSSPLFCNVSSFKSTIGPELDLRRLRLMILCHKSFGKRWNWTNIKPTWNCVIFKMKSCFRLSQAGPATACGNLGLG